MFVVRRLAASPHRTAVTAKACRHFSRSIAPSAKYSSFADPETNTLFKVDSKDLKNPRDAQLRADVRAMGSLLGQIINDHHGKDIFDKVERMRSLAKSWREAGAGRIPETAEGAASTLNELSLFASTLSNEDLFLVSRAFTHFLAIANAAEGHHRSRRIQEREPNEGDIHALSNKSDSCGGVLPDLAKKHGKDMIWETLTTQVVELVLTAHPTEVNRRTILNKKRRVQQVRTMNKRLSQLRIILLLTFLLSIDLDESRRIQKGWKDDSVSRESAQRCFAPRDILHLAVGRNISHQANAAVRSRTWWAGGRDSLVGSSSAVSSQARCDHEGLSW
jgi:hypothetical protein